MISVLVQRSIVRTMYLYTITPIHTSNRSTSTNIFLSTLYTSYSSNVAVHCTTVLLYNWTTALCTLYYSPTVQLYHRTVLRTVLTTYCTVIRNVRGLLLSGFLGFFACPLLCLFYGQHSAKQTEGNSRLFVPLSPLPPLQLYPRIPWYLVGYLELGGMVCVW
jgi:hypothetical protein